MSKVTKKQLQRDIELLESGIGMNWSDMKKIETRLNHAMNEMAQQLEALEEFATYADNMLTELNHALPDPEYDAKCEAQEADINASLDRHRERLGLNKPQLKQLDQSVFNGLDEKWRFAAVDADGTRCDYETKPRLDHAQWACVLGGFRRHVGEHDASNWQNSLIERDIAKELAEVDLSSELTGSELCRAMLERGDKYVLCRTIGGVDVISGTYEDGYFVSLNGEYEAVAPINNQGEPLTQSDVGL